MLAAVMDTVTMSAETPGRIATADLLKTYRDATGDDRAPIERIRAHLHMLGLKSGAKLGGGNKRGWSYDFDTLRRRAQELGLEE